MTKTAQGQSALGESKKRLQEIAEIRLGTLSDDEILRFLAERKRLTDVEREYEKVQKEEEARLERERKAAENLKAAEKKKAAISKKIEELNKSISGEVPDDDLLVLVAKRRELEKELEEADGETFLRKEEPASAPVPPLPVVAETIPEKEHPKPEPKAATPAATLKEEVTLADDKKVVVTEVSPLSSKTRVDGGYGDEKILNDDIEDGSGFQRYFDQLKDNVGSLGTLLQNMPLDAKRNKAFMLKVAEIDPAYAMHYADKETLKKDEDFNIRVVSLKNPRNSGNAIAEMLPEARTSKVLLAAVKQDYRNVRFIQPSMADYDAMIDIAKRGALEKVKNLKEAVDIMLLIPKLLQQDKPFMLQVKEITEPKKEK